MARRTRLRIVAAVSAIVVTVPVFSATRYVLANPNEPLQQNLASWAREKGLGGVVDQLEAWMHNDPPAVAPTDTLTLLPTDDTTADTLPVETLPPDTTVADGSDTDGTGSGGGRRTTTTTAPSNAKPLVTRPRTASASCPTPKNGSTTTSSSTTTTTTTTTSTLPGATTVPTTTTTTTTTIPARPANVAPFIDPAIKGEGVWRSAGRVDDQPYLFVNSVRPLWCYGSVVATMAAWNPNILRTAMYNGSEVPGGKGWKNGSRVRGNALKTLLGSFNGGFRFEHSPGGYMTEGRVVQKMVKGYATLGIRPDGTATIGVWGHDMKDPDSWSSLRQNLPPLVENARSVYANYPKVDWGKDFGNKVFNFRSAVCVRTDGLMMFVAVGKVNIGMLADTLVLLGCRTAMELDINGTWPQFALYGRYGKMDRTAQVIDTRMGDPMRHLNGSTKDFFGLFFSEQLLSASTSTTTIAPVVP